MSTNSSPLVATHLRCLGIHAPRGVEHPAPPLSWRLSGNGDDRSQTAYQVLVATDPNKLAVGRADLWDSGRVPGGVSTNIVYGGSPLASRSCCFWTVRVWDERDVIGEFAAPSSWEMGMLHEDEWTAQWIASESYPTILPGSKLAPSPLLRREIRIDRPVWRATAYVSGLGYYEMQINGRKVGDHVLDPIPTKYDVRTHYVVHDVTLYLSPGANAIGMMLGTGFYNCHTKEVWDFEQASWRDRPKAIVQVEIEFEDGSSCTIGTDTSWRTSTGPVLFDGLRNGEFYDARAEKPGWSSPGYDDSAWPNAIAIAPPGGVLSAQLVPTKVMATIDAITVTEVSPGVFVADLGQNIAGWAQICASAPAGTEITLRYAEKLLENGDIDVSNINAFIKSGEFQTDKYTFKGDGSEVWEPRFTYHGFRYIQISGYPGTWATSNIKGRVVHTVFDLTGDFACSDSLLTAIYEAEKWTYTGNFVGIPLDCPQREKNGWTGDTQIATETGLFMFDSGPAYAKWLVDIGDAMRPSGQLPGIVPTGGWGYNWGSGPSWDSALTHIPWYVYLYDGNVDILARHYDQMKRYVRYMGKMATGHILSFGLGDWLQPTDPDKRTPVEILSTGYYYANAKIVANIARLLGHQADAEKYDALAGQIKAAFNQSLYDPETGMYRGNTQTGQACALFHGLVDADQDEKVFAELVKLIEANDYKPAYGIIGVKYVPEVLARFGRSDIVLRMTTQTQYPSYAAWFERGATTMFEDWKGEGSLNHVALGAICEWMNKHLLGIQLDPGAPGFKHVVIAPSFVPGLTWAKGSHESPYGEIAVSWAREGDDVTLNVALPVNTTATVLLPTSGDDRTHTQTEIGSGQRLFRFSLTNA